VKVINQNGQIYLKGPVANSTERTKVEDIAKRFAGNMTVVNQTYVEKK
jgi:osmotically-inducible protein OsmY